MSFTPEDRQAGGAAVRIWVLAAIAAAVFIFCGCGGGSAPPIEQPVAPASNPGTGTVFVQFTEIGKDVGVTGKIVSPLVEKALRSAKIKLVPAEDKAELLIHGIVKLQLQDTTRRLGLDMHTYAAEVDWQITRLSGLSVLVSRTESRGTGTGKDQAITNTLSSLADKIAAEALPRLKQVLPGK